MAPIVSKSPLKTVVTDFRGPHSNFDRRKLTAAYGTGIPLKSCDEKPLKPILHRFHGTPE